MKYVGKVFTFGQKPQKSKVLKSKADTKQWCAENYTYGNDVWVILTDDGIVVDTGLCDHGFQEEE